MLGMERMLRAEGCSGQRGAQSRGMLRAEGSESSGFSRGAALGTDDNFALLSLAWTSFCTLSCRDVPDGDKSKSCAWVSVPSCHLSWGEGRRRTQQSRAWLWQRWTILLAHPEPVAAEQ